MHEKYPHTYHAYGLSIRSQIPVTGFEPAPVDIADVFIREGIVPERLEHVINRGVLFESNESEFLLRLEKVAAFYIHHGNEIITQRMGQVAAGELSAFIIGTCFGALFHQRRLLPLHASTVIYKEKCFVFAGLSGAGKTTLAAALVKDGATLVADDISVIDFSAERPAVCPAFPAIKIWADSLRHLGISAEGLEPVRDEMLKYYLPVHSFSRTYTSIHGIYILGTHNLPEIVLKPLQGVDKFRALKKHTYLFRGIPKTGLELNHFQLVNQLAACVPVTILTRPNASFNTDSMVEVISENL